MVMIQNFNGCHCLVLFIGCFLSLSDCIASTEKWIPASAHACLWVPSLLSINSCDFSIPGLDYDG